MFITQVVHVHDGKEDLFDEFESHAIPLIHKHGGELLLRLRPTPDTVVTASMALPYEVHLIHFPSDEAFATFAADEERQRFLHLKNAAVRASLIVRGSEV